MSLPDSKWFKPKDGACHDGTPYPDNWLVQWLASSAMADKARDMWGGPLEAVSWYRTPAHNQQLIDSGKHDVASASIHLTGMAVDLRPVGIYARSFVDPVLALHSKILSQYKADNFPELGGLGLYGRGEWVHLDLHKATDGHLRRWSTRI